MELREGKITDEVNRKLTDTATGTPDLLYENPGAIVLIPDNRVNFIAIIAKTPNGERVINTIKERLS